MDEPVTTTAQRGSAKTARIPIKVLAETAPALAKPRGIRVRVAHSETFRGVKQVLREQGLHTVCEEAACPNIGEHQVDMLTVGQYLQPRPGNLPVRRDVTPDAFDALAEQARRMRFQHATCRPLVRSSYHADRQAQAAELPLSSTKNH